MATSKSPLLTGVIEGFYGPPWSKAERVELFDWLAGWGLNTYLYALKDDLKNRALWREPYTPAETTELAGLIDDCQKRNLYFIYALSPGLDIRYHDDTERAHIQARFERLIHLGCRHFALLFDDIPDRMAPEDRKRWSSFASAQCFVANEIFRWVRSRCPEGRFLFCPTPYCGRMRERGLGGTDYLPTIGRELLPEIEVFWTGPEIISAEITLPHIRELQTVLRRKPIIWDNLHANDYDGRRFYCGPYAGRPLELRQEVTGLLANPNNEFLLNYVPLRTMAEFVHCPPTGEWAPRNAYLSAISEWLPRFRTSSATASLEDLVLFGDCYYLPHELGPEALKLYDQIRNFLTHPTHGAPAVEILRQRLAQLRNFCARLSELRDRSLFYALSRRAWELREELDLLDRAIDFLSSPQSPGIGFTADFHLPGTYRGGMVPQLQRLLLQHPDGTFTPASLAGASLIQPEATQH